MGRGRQDGFPWKEAFSMEGGDTTLQSSGFYFLSSSQIKTAFHRVFPDEARRAKLPALSTCQRVLTLVHRSELPTLTFRDPDHTKLAILTA